MFNEADLIKISEEIDAKKMAPFAKVLKALEELGEYCPRCECDEPTIYYDPTGTTGPTLRCLFCGYSIKMETIIKHARDMPCDYLERLIALPAKETRIEQVGTDTWISGPYCAELAGKLPHSYPDRDKFQTTDAIGRLLSGLDMNQFEAAELTKELYRSYGDVYIARLKSKSYEVFINEKYAQSISGIYKAYVRGPQDMVLVKVGSQIRQIIMPIRMNSNHPLTTQKAGGDA